MKNKTFITSLVVILLVSCTPSHPPTKPTLTPAISNPLLITPSLESTPSTTPTSILPTFSPTEYPAPTTYYPMSTIQVVAVRPGGKELYAYSGDKSDMILVIDIDSPDYPVIGKIDLPGTRPNHSYISFSTDGKRAFLSRALECRFEDKCDNFGDFVYMVVIDTEKKGN